MALVRSFATFGGTATTTTSVVPMPTIANGAAADWQVGDVVYIGYELTATSGTVTTPGGWTSPFTPFRAAAATNCIHGVLRRVMQAGDPNTLTLTHTSGRFAAVAVAVQDADQTTPEDVTPTTDDNTGVTYPSVRAPSITPAAVDALLLTFHAVRNGTNSATTTFTPPAGMTECGDATSNLAAASNAAVEAASLQLASAAATGAKTATAASSSGTTTNMMGSTFAIRSAAAAPAAAGFHRRPSSRPSFRR